MVERVDRMVVEGLAIPVAHTKVTQSAAANGGVWRSTWSAKVRRPTQSQSRRQYARVSPKATHPSKGQNAVPDA